ncbi:MAG TPA: SpoIIE family protein phosphatase [Spirochaetota bacterium]|nr:SpoIIE family protein phosphatase [Spirochaetota bacterium]HOS33353.1 SpoIIE family protein phosphatase [Spirochaetota bacterium]HOS56125.1 SpoIIE family protein phosphatase [Spirochaetota bacterium]HQF77657.1 SpoIIE family protein phosphatase [Spirochaetota bacterium]HQH29833.1 SpoIIE family protein phosphatase [Spirochaetota bacterium]
MRKLFLLTLIFFSSIKIDSIDTTIFWDNEKEIIRANVGKFDTFFSNDFIGLVYSDANNKNKLYCIFSSDGKNFSKPYVLTNNFYAKNNDGVDFSVAIDANSKLYLAFRTDKNKLEVNTFGFPFEQKNRLNKTVITSPNILFLPEIAVSADGTVFAAYSTNINNDLKIGLTKISQKGDIIDTQILGSNLKSSLNPVLKEYGDSLYLVFQSKDNDDIPTVINERSFFREIINKITDIQDKTLMQNSYKKDPMKSAYKLIDDISSADKTRIKEILLNLKYNNPANISYSIYVAKSDDGGVNWSYFRVVTTYGENNQRPDFIINGDRMSLVWEKDDDNLISHIYYANLNVKNWNILEEIIISERNSDAYLPSLIEYNKSIFVFWYDNTDGTFQNYYREALEVGLSEVKPVKKMKGRTFLNSVGVFKEAPVIMWGQNFNNSVSIYTATTDNFVEAPRVFIKNHSGKKYLNRTEVKFEWNTIKDASGLYGYRAILTRDKDEKISGGLSDSYIDETVNYREYSIPEEGEWFFKIMAYDKAGNVSAESVYSVSIDVTPPPPPVLSDMKYDADGALTTNSPIIKWKPSEDGATRYKYYYKFFLNENEKNSWKLSNKITTDDFTYTNDNFIKFYELDNGFLTVGLQCFDEAGNISEISWNEFKLNKYVVKTVISSVKEKKRGDFVTFDIFGRGFNIEEEISSIVADKDMKPPFDYELNRNYFDIIDDRTISQKIGVEIYDGIYNIGLVHPVRGVVFFDKKFKFEQKWAFVYEKKDIFKEIKIRYIANEFNATTIIISSILIIWSILVLFVVMGAVQIKRETVQLNRLIAKYDQIKEDYYSGKWKISEKKELLMKKKLGLTVKYGLLILFLVFLVVTGTSITISAITLRSQRENLAQMMKDKAELVMKNFNTSISYIYNTTRNDYDAYDSLDTFTKLTDVGFVTFRKNGEDLTVRYGKTENLKIFLPDIDVDMVDNKTLDKLINDNYFKQILNDKIKIFKEDKNAVSIIYPDFDVRKLNNRYIFINPIYTLSKEYIGEICIGFSFINILNMIEVETKNLIKITVLVTIGALLMSIIGSLFLATNTIRPIKKISEHVNIIAETEDYEKLIGTENEKIEINSGDEIGVLAYSINDMTYKLIEKSKSDKQLLLGKEIQKKFIPLEPFENDFVDIYGFYEGAKGVSGDYFDYKKLDEEHYAFIICDVSGKAVPAALIMVQISTIFRSFFSNFNVGKDKLDTVKIVNQINDTVEERGFQGRFAAILVSIYNIKTGKMILTNAGYTKLLVYRDHKKETEWISLADSGAAGIFPSFMLPSPFKLETLQINRGDIIFLFTDGIEEARNGQTIITSEGEEKEDEFGNERIKEVLDKSDGKTSKEIVELLIGAQNEYRGDFEQYDDLTLLAIRRK